MTATPVEGTETSSACSVDRPCTSDSSCGCDAPIDAESGPAVVPRRGAKAALVAMLCTVACLVVPLAAAGVATVGGTLAGQWWLVAVALAVTTVAVGVIVRRRGYAGC